MFVGVDGKEISTDEWIKLCRTGGIGFVIAEQWLPTPGGDTLIKTCFFGIVLPEAGVRAFGTAKSQSPHGMFTELEQYDTHDEALAGHHKWVNEIAFPKTTGETP